MRHFLDFEKPIASLEGKVEELRHMSTDGSINIAAAIQPIETKESESIEKLPILLALHGTGVEPTSMADSFKYIPTNVPKEIEDKWIANYIKSKSSNDKNNKMSKKIINKIIQDNLEIIGYLFGIENAWVIAPHRQGAHNWETTGFRSCLSSVHALEKIISRI